MVIVFLAALFLALGFAGCSGFSSKDGLPFEDGPSQTINSEDPSESLFELVYEQRGAHTFHIYRYVPNDTLFLVRANQGGIVQMFNSFDETYPTHYTEDLAQYLDP